MDKYNFGALAKERYSCRSYKPEPISEEHLNIVLEAALAAPTGCNMQPWRILVIKSPEALAKLSSCTPYTFGAPCVLAVLADSREGWTRKYDGKSCRETDAAIAASHIILQAASLGLGTCWVMSFDPFRFAADFELEKNLIPAALIPIGYPADNAVPAPMHSSSRSKEELIKII